MRAGPLRHRVALQALVKVPDGGGGFSEVWVEQRKVWVRITLPTGRTSSVANQLQAVVSAEIQARPSGDLIAGRRLVHKTVTYVIEAALPDNDISMLRLLCSSLSPTPG
ncbi:head-tail adaptor protein [Pseudomonas citronellolis]|uniref:head-tail adaptor protein n=1 Tax=Pseudomonas citronellolis TaxID=53408 RepID=UPI0007188852|nr:head-tail adaptor protein [Pseudomonas citronellolis]KRV76385.1 head-tail adaptor protein [Pseudomonas citronellolis]KRW79580.1 head-tail adaptor protein [Pseudomonas citronellolis]